MKPLISGFIILLCTVVAFIAHAQCPSNKGQLEITASYGILTGDQINLATKTSTGTEVTYHSGASFGSARYFIYNRLALGFAGGFIDEKGASADRSDPSMVKSTYTQRATTIALEIYYIYTFRKYFEVYSILGAGPSYLSSTTTVNATAYNPERTIAESHEIFKMQYTPIGIRVGGHLAAFAELGIGYKGLFNAGISYKFGSPCWWKQYK